MKISGSCVHSHVYASSFCSRFILLEISWRVWCCDLVDSHLYLCLRRVVHDVESMRDFSDGDGVNANVYHLEVSFTDLVITDPIGGAVFGDRQIRKSFSRRDRIDVSRTCPCLYQTRGERRFCITHRVLGHAECIYPQMCQSISTTLKSPGGVKGVRGRTSPQVPKDSK